MSSSGGVDESTSVLSLSTTDQLPMVRSIVAPGAGRPDRVDGSHADVADHPLPVRPTSAMSSMPAAASLPCHVRQSASLPLVVSSEFLSTTFGAGDPRCIRQSDGAARASNASHPSGKLRRRPIDGRPRASYVSVAQIAERLVILGQTSTAAHLTTAVLPMTMGWTEGYQHFPTDMQALLRGTRCHPNSLLLQGFGFLPSPCRGAVGVGHVTPLPHRELLGGTQVDSEASATAFLR